MTNPIDPATELINQALGMEVQQPDDSSDTTNLSIPDINQSDNSPEMEVVNNASQDNNDMVYSTETTTIPDSVPTNDPLEGLSNEDLEMLNSYFSNQEEEVTNGERVSTSTHLNTTINNHNRPFFSLYDLIKGPASGLATSIKEINDLVEITPTGMFIKNVTDTVSEALTGKKQSERLQEDYDRLQSYIHPDSVVGDVAKAITQYASVFIPGMGTATGAGLIGKTPGLLRSFITTQVIDGLASSVPFEAHEQNMSNLIQEFPMLRNGVTEFLASNPDDPEALGKFKNFIDGAGFGALTDGLFALGLTLKSGRTALKEGGETAARKAASNIIEKISKAPVDLKVQDLVDTPTLQGSVKVTRDVSLMDSEGYMKALSESIDSKASVASPTTPINWSKVNSTEDGNRTFTELVAATKSTLDNRNPKRTLKEIDEASQNLMAQDIADMFGGDPSTIVTRLKGLVNETQGMEELLVASKTYLDSLMRGVGEQARKAQVNAVNGLIDAEDLLEFRKRSSIALDFMSDLSTIQTRAARTTTAGRIETSADNILTNGEIQSLLGSEGLDIERTVGLIASTYDGSAGSLSQVAKSLKMSFWDKAGTVGNEIYMAGLVSSVRSLEKATLSSFTRALTDPAERFIGSVLGLPLGNKESKRIAQESIHAYVGMFKSLQDSFSAARKVLNTGSTILDPKNAYLNEMNLHNGAVSSEFILGRSEPFLTDPNAGLIQQSETMIKNMLADPMAAGMNWIGKTLRVPGFHMLSSMDEFMKQMTYRSSIYAEATVEGLSNGLKGADLDDFITSKVYASFDPNSGAGLNEYMLKRAQETAFTKPLKGDTIVSILGQALQTINKKSPVLGRHIGTFIVAPANMLDYALGRIPGLNFINELPSGKTIQQLKAGGVEQIEALGRLSAATVMSIYIYMLAANGMITGAGPRDPGRRNALRSTGWEPYSFMLPQKDGTLKAYSYQNFENIATPFGLVTDLVQNIGFMKKHEWQDYIGVVITALADNITSKSYLTSMTDLLALFDSKNLSPGQTAERWLNNQVAAHIIPNWITNFDRDPNFRAAHTMADTLNKKLGLNGFMDEDGKLFGKYPLPEGLSKEIRLDPIRDWRGRTTLKPYAYGQWAFRTKEHEQDAIDKEIYRLLTNGANLPLDPAHDEMIDSSGVLEYNLDLTTYKNDKGYSAADYRRSIINDVELDGRIMSEVLSDLISSDEYKEILSDTGKVEAIQNVVKKFKNAANQITQNSIDYKNKDGLTVYESVLERKYMKELKQLQEFSNIESSENPLQDIQDRLGGQ